MPGLELVPLTPEIALDSSRLPAVFHGDPADRIIVATARSMAARLLTRDQRLAEYGRHRHVAIF
jgi:PIN domain nuclease of toxin-antitoxin system